LCSPNTLWLQRGVGHAAVDARLAAALSLLSRGRHAMRCIYILYMRALYLLYACKHLELRLRFRSSLPLIPAAARAWRLLPILTWRLTDTLILFNNGKENGW